MAVRKKEIAKFLCGAEAFHTGVHAVLALSGTAMTIFGIAFQPAWHIGSAVINLLITLALASYAWGIFGRRASRGEL
jgi:membrane-bound ClpP family serine protease